MKNDSIPLPDYNSLLVDFATGEKKKYNVKPLFDKWESFKALLLVQRLFEQVKVDVGGYGISWNDNIDLSCNELYENGKLISLSADCIIGE
jgi:hypothetical protein